MPGGYGSYHNGCAVGVFWDSIEFNLDGSQARITNARIKIDRSQNINDSTNKLSWSGGAISDGSSSNINLDGSGEKTVKSCTETWCDLSYTGTTSHGFNAEFSGIGAAGTTLTVNKSITYPQRLFNQPEAPVFIGVGFTGSLGNFTIEWVNNSTTEAPWTTLDLYRVEVDSGITTMISVPSPSTATSIDQIGLDPTKQYWWQLVATNNRGSTQSPDSGTTPDPLHAMSMDYSSCAIGEAVTFTIDKHGSSYNSKIRIDDQVAYDTGAETSVVYTFSQNPWSGKMSKVTSKSFTVYLDTYTTGDVLIGTFTYLITVTVPNTEPYIPNCDTPTITETITDISTAFTAGTYIQGYSVIRVACNGSAGDSATITKKEVIVNGFTYDVTALGYTDIPVTWNTSPTAQSRVTDSRSRVSTSATVVVKGYAYSKPVITTFKAERCNNTGILTNDGTYVKFTINVAATSVNDGTEKNKLNYTVKSVDKIPSSADLTNKFTDIPLTYSGTTEALGAGAYSTSASYSFIITVSDKLASSTTTRIVSIPTEIVPLSIGNNGIAVGKVYNDPTKALDVVGNVLLTGNVEITGTLTGGSHNHNNLYYTESEIDNLLLTKQAVGSYAEASHTHPFSNITHTDLDNGIDLNTLTSKGLYHQGDDIQAAGGSNYPEACAGMLEVFSPNATFIYQRYTTYQGYLNRVWVRSYYNGTWTTWTTDNRMRYRGKMSRSSGLAYSAATWTKMSMFTLDYNENMTGMDVADGSYNITIPGQYDILFQTRWQYYGSVYSRSVAIVKGGSAPATDASNVLATVTHSGSDWLISQCLAMDVTLAADEYVTFWVRSATASTINQVNTTIPGWSYATISKRA